MVGLVQGRIEVRKKERILRSVPAQWIKQILLMGNIMLSPAALRHCCHENIPLVYVSTRGHFWGRLEGGAPWAIHTLKQQLAMQDNPTQVLNWAKAIVVEKLKNSLGVFRKRHRKGEHRSIDQACDQLAHLADKARLATTLESVRGFEGRGAAVYFAAWKHWIPEPFSFSNRNRRPPKDPVNALLSFGYTLLMNQMHSMVMVAGLHPSVGYLHESNDRYPGLVLDLMEEFRAPLVDTLVMAVLNRSQFTPQDFTLDPISGGCMMRDEARKRWVALLEERMAKAIRIPGESEPASYRHCMLRQAEKAKDVIFNPGSTYQPFEWYR